MSASANKPSNPHPLPLGADLDPTIERLRAIAARAGDALLTEGPVQPDHQLLDLCAEALHLLKQSNAMWKARDAVRWVNRKEWAEEDRKKDDDLFKAASAMKRRAAKILWLAKKLPAKTPAGIYAKALIVRTSRTGAAELAMSLADDLISSAAVRATLWPAGEV
jgi:hypothetical protein